MAGGVDVGTELVQTLGEVLVPTRDHVRGAQHRGALGRQHRQQDHHGRTQRRRADDLGAGEVRRALDHHAVRVEQLDLAAELVELGQVDRAVLVDPVVQQCLALGDGRDHGEERQVVDVEAGERHRVDLVERSAQHGALGDDVDQPGLAVEGGVLRATLVGEAHLLQGRELDLHELDRHPADGDLGAGHDRRGEQRHRLDGVLGRRVLEVDVDLLQARDGERGGADALDGHAELLQVEAQVLDHVVRRGVADHGGAGVQRRGHQRVLRDGVAALGEDDRAAGLDLRVDRGVVRAVGGLDLQPERTQRGHVRLDGAFAEVAAAGVRQLELLGAVQQRAQEHDHRAGTTGGGLVDRVETQHLGRDDLEVVVLVEPAGLHAQGVEHLEQAVDLLDARDLAQRRAPLVQQGGAQQRDPGVLRGLDVDLARQGGGAGDTQVRRTGAEGDDLGLQSAADPRDHLQREVLLALLDAVDGALRRGQALRELRLGQPTVLAGVADQVADTALVVIRHAEDDNSHMR